MPQPWPTVSADHAIVTSTLRIRAGGVVKLPVSGIARHADVGEILERHAIEDALARRQVGERDARREIGGLERGGAGHATHVANSRWSSTRRPSAPGDRCGSRSSRGRPTRRRRRRPAASPASLTAREASAGASSAAPAESDRRTNARRSMRGVVDSLQPRGNGAQLARRRHAVQSSRPATRRARSLRPSPRRPARRRSSDSPRRPSVRSPAQTPCRRRRPCATGRSPARSRRRPSARRGGSRPWSASRWWRPGRSSCSRRRAARDGACSAPLRSSLRTSASALPSSLRTPATTLPVVGSMMSPTALTATIAATTRPLGSVMDADPRPPFIERPRPILPTVAPAPAPTLPSATGRRSRPAPPCSRSRRSAGSSACRRTPGRTGSPPARSARRPTPTFQPMFCSSR